MKAKPLPQLPQRNRRGRPKVKPYNPNTGFVLWLKSRGLSETAAAAALGLSVHAVYQYANGLRRVHGAVATLMRYIDRYGIMKDE